jgi:signal transduction histidine kinase
LLFERLRGEVAERTRAEATVRFLANAGTELSASLDEPVLHEKVAHLVVPAIADWCVVDIVDDDGRIRRVASAHVDPVKADTLRELLDLYAPDWNSPQPSPLVLRTGTPLLVDELTDEHLRSMTRAHEHARLVRSFGARSLLIVPMVAHGRTMGSLTCVSGASGRRFTPADQTVAAELAYRAALALENARLFKSAKKAVQVREDFLSVASHELHTPLTSLMLSVQSIERERIPVTPETMKATIARIGRQGRRLSRLVDDLLDVTQIASNRLSVDLGSVDLAALVEEVVERFDDEFVRADAPVTVRADGQPIGTWDRSRLDQVVSNLLSNAIKFGAGAPIEVTVDRLDDRALLVVRDRGIGIAPDRLPHVFERFERGVSASQYGGLGLGLYIVRSIVQGLGGEVTCESRLGEGARFVVSLPLSPATGPGRP